MKLLGQIFFFWGIHCQYLTSAYFQGIGRSLSLRKIVQVVQLQGATEAGSSAEFDLDKAWDVPSFLSDQYTSEQFAGVIAVANAAGEIQYIGASRNVAHDVSSLRSQKGSETVHTLRIQTFPGDIAGASEAMDAYCNELLSQLGESPIGNKEGWVCSPGFAQSPLTPAEPAAQELGVKRQSLAAKIKEQKEHMAHQQVDSPFQPPPQVAMPAINNIQPAPGTALDFTEANVDRVLDQIRPYLIQDGGNVAIAELIQESREVRLYLEGACGSCPSSTTTMKVRQSHSVTHSHISPRVFESNPSELCALLACVTLSTFPTLTLRLPLALFRSVTTDGDRTSLKREL